MVTIEGSHNTEFQSSSEGRVHIVEYKPHEPGAYQMFILFADEPVPGQPFVDKQLFSRKQTLILK